MLRRLRHFFTAKSRARDLEEARLRRQIAGLDREHAEAVDRICLASSALASLAAAPRRRKAPRRGPRSSGRPQLA